MVDEEKVPFVEANDSPDSKLPLQGQATLLDPVPGVSKHYSLLLFKSLLQLMLLSLICSVL